MRRSTLNNKRTVGRRNQRQSEAKKWAAARRRELWEKKEAENRRRWPGIFSYLYSQEFHDWYERATGVPFPESFYAFESPELIRLVVEQAAKDEEWANQKREIQIGTLNDPDIPTRQRRRLAILWGTPKWVDRGQVREIYRKRDRMNIEAPHGVEYEVDHLVPLLGKEVCGLHCESNLRVIEVSENRAKSNRIREVDRAEMEAVV